jgi:hypothetical protein
MAGVGRSSRKTWLRRSALTLALGASILVPLAGVTASPAGAVAAAAPTTSYYEQNASTANLYLQGETAGQASTQGIVILDFGRPASDGTSDGTLDFGRTFVSFADIVGAVQNFIIGYYNAAPAYTTIDVAVGTNNSCGMFQPCGAVICGCPDEPSNYITWGHELANAVVSLRAWAVEYGSANGFTDTVRVVAGDDAEPAFDPGYYNTYDVMEGYAQAVGGSIPPMVDYGSADPGFWTEDQLLQIANGFAPNVAMPELYNADQVDQWANLVAYANTNHNEAVTIFGVMTTAGGTLTSPDAVSQMLGAVAGISGQSSIPWASAITD